MLGDDPRRIFLIKIAKSKTVSALRDAIKDKIPHRLNGIDAIELTLYKVTIFDDDNLAQTLKTLRFDGSDDRIEKLRDISPLSEVFPDGVERNHLHIVVRAPPAGEFDNDQH